MKLMKLIMWRSFSSHKESYCQEIWEELEGETFLSLKVELRICEASNSKGLATLSIRPGAWSWNLALDLTGGDK